MKKLVVFVGESGSGKTTLINRLATEYPESFVRVVTCTNRPMRTGEINGVDYHFLSQEGFDNNQGMILVNRTSDGFYYGTKSLDLLPSIHHLLLTLRLAGVQKLINLGFRNVVVARIAINESLKIERIYQRGDTEKMILNRLQSDVDDKTEIDLSKIEVIDLSAKSTIQENVNCVLRRVGN